MTKNVGRWKVSAADGSGLHIVFEHNGVEVSEIRSYGNGVEEDLRDLHYAILRVLAKIEERRP